MLPENVCASKNDPSLTTNSSPCGNINSCTVPELMPPSLHFKVQITLRGQNCSATVAAMVNSGATALFISKIFVKENKSVHTLSYPKSHFITSTGSKTTQGVSLA
jgi:hypothetical protein